MVLDQEGNELKKEKTEKEVLDKLAELAPKTVEEQKILVKKVSELAEHHRKQRMNYGLNTGFNEVFKDNELAKVHKDNYTQDRGYRHIASIPSEIAFVAEEVFGPEVWSNKAVFKKAFVEDETGKLCLRVDPKTI